MKGRRLPDTTAGIGLFSCNSGIKFRNCSHDCAWGILETALGRAPVCALLGPRQCGKTTLAQAIAVGMEESHYFDLESPRDQLRLQNPELALGTLTGLVVLDEVQTAPALFPVLRVLADRL